MAMQTNDLADYFLYKGWCGVVAALHQIKHSATKIAKRTPHTTAYYSIKKKVCKVCIIDRITLEKCVQTYQPKVCMRSAWSALFGRLYADLVCTVKKTVFTLVDEPRSMHTCRPCRPCAYVVGKRGVGCVINTATFQ